MSIYRGAGGSISGEADTIVIPVSQGGTGATTIAEARLNINAAKSGINSDITQLLGLEQPLSVTQGGTGSKTASGALTNLGAATAAQGALADTALQTADVATVALTGSYNDLLDLPTAGSGDVVGPASSTDGAVALFDGTTGKLLKDGVVLGTAATTNSTAYATAAQGALADSAIQSSDLATVATTGAYSDLSGKPTLGTAAAQDVGYFATAAQGTKADSALQSSAIGVSIQVYNANTVVDASYVHTDNNYTTTEKSKLAGIAAGAEVNVNADWTASSGDAQILNKPTLGTAASTDSTAYATAAQGSNADTAYGWGNHASAGYLTSYTETDPVYTASSWYSTTNNASNWNTAYGWGNHASAGYLTSETYTGTVTSVAMTVPTGLSVSGTPITSTGTLAVTLAAGYSIPTTTKQTEWDTAYTDRNKWDGGATDLVAATGRTSLGVTATGSDTTYAYRANNLSDLANAATARSNLGLVIGTDVLAPNGSAASLTSFPTLNQNTTGTAANITATSNSTLTTLSALSLPGSQVTGDISGNAGNVTGTVAIANGGTGQTTATAAFDALAPTTTKGDLIVNNGTDNVRLAAGSNTQVLTVDSSTATGVKWATPEGGNITTKVMWENALTISTDYTITTGNSAMSAGPITISSGSSVTIPSGSRWVIV